MVNLAITEPVDSAIQTEVGYINKKRGESVAKGIVRANKDADELIRCYRRIEALFRLLQVSVRGR